MEEWKGLWIKTQELLFLVLTLSLISFVRSLISTFCIWTAVSSSDIYKVL